MDIVTTKNRLIQYMTYNRLNKELVKEIQESLLSSKNEIDLDKLLEKVENEIAILKNYDN